MYLPTLRAYVSTNNISFLQKIHPTFKNGFKLNSYKQNKTQLKSVVCSMITYSMLTDVLTLQQHILPFINKWNVHFRT